MFDRAWGGLFRGSRVTRDGETRHAGRRHRPQLEPLEGRQLLAASLAPIADVSVPANLGFQVPLDGSGSGAATQSFTVTSSNPDIPASVAVGKFLTLTVTHEQANANDVLVQNAPITYQLFDDLTPLTAGKIESFVQMNPSFYNGKNFHRVASGFPTASDFIIQGGSASGDGSGFSGIAGNPFVDEFNQQLAFTGTDQLAMANSGPDTNDTQFFMTTGSPQFLNFKHTVFGQVVSGFQTVSDLAKVAVGGTDGTTPLSPILINSSAITTQNPNGVIHLDATKAKAGETSLITVAATDPATNTTTSRSFTVTVTAPTQNERPFLQQLPYPTQVVTTTPGSTTQPAVVYTQNVAVNQQDIFQIPAVDAENDTLTYAVHAGVTTDPTTGAQTFTDIPATQGAATVDQSTGIVTFTPAQGFTGPVNMLVGVRDQTNRGASGVSLDDPSNFDYHQIILNVAGTTPVALTPIAAPVTQTAAANTATPVQLNGVSANPATSTGLTYTLVSQPTHGTISQFNANTGSLVYTAAPNFEGSDSFQYTVTDQGTGTTALTSPAATVTINVTQAATGTVRQIGNVLVVTPNPGPLHGTNNITISQVNDPTNAANDKLQVVVNGVIDQTQPLVSDINRVVVYGSKASDKINVDENVDPAILVTLDGGHGGTNVVQAGAGFSREHGWFGRNTLKGGSGPNVLIGREGHVKFKPTPSTIFMFAGKGHPPQTPDHHHVTPPSGTFFKSVNGRIVPVPTPPGRPRRHK
jgi:cyclophilin family peptidyl-prolyl cis-trans isomerase